VVPPCSPHHAERGTATATPIFPFIALGRRLTSVTHTRHAQNRDATCCRQATSISSRATPTVF
jgi:hypothetical protein